MRYPSRLDHELFELTTQLCTRFLHHNVISNAADDACNLQQWCDLVDQGACMDETFPLQYISPSQHGQRRCLEVSSLELMLMCWPWETLAAGLQHIHNVKPLEDLVFPRLSALAMNNGNEWHHIGFPGTNEQDTQHHVMSGLSRWFLGYEQRKSNFAPKMGWWEVIGLREKLDFNSSNAVHIIEGLVQTLPPLEDKGFEHMLKHVRNGLLDQTYGTRFGLLLAVLVHPYTEDTCIKQQQLQQQLLANNVNSRVKNDAADLHNASELAERARVSKGLNWDDAKKGAQRKM